MNVERDRPPLLEGAIVGVAAWLIGYASVYVLVAPEVRASPLHRFIEAFEGEPATYEMIGWVFYNAHFVSTVFQNVPLIGSHTTTFIGGEDGFTHFMYAIPVVLLLAAGVALSFYRRASDPTQGALAGVSVLPGYLLPSIVGVFIFEVSLGGASGAPDLIPAIFLGGIVFPALFAGLGGAIAASLHRPQP